MKIVNGIRIHTIDLTEQSIATIHRLATLAMAPHQALLDEIAPQLPRQSAQNTPIDGNAPHQDQNGMTSA